MPMSPGPYTANNGLTAEQRDALVQKLRRQGVRELPFPFSSAVSIVSDLDGSTKDRFNAYTRLFDWFGLDFGDSTWLKWSVEPAPSAKLDLGFFAPDYSVGDNIPDIIYTKTRTFNESVEEFLEGHIDHFHSLFKFGPRSVFIKHSTSTDGDECLIELNRIDSIVNGDLRNFRVFGVAVLGGCTDASLRTISGSYVEGLSRKDSPQQDSTLFLMDFDRAQPPVGPKASDIASIRIEGAVQDPAVLLIGAPTDLILECLERLSRYNVQFNLLTEHSRLYFRTPAGAALDDNKLREKLTVSGPVCEPVVGTLEADGELIFSTDADHPQSVSRVLPEMFGFGLRHMVIAAASGARGFAPLDLISPTPTRAGGSAYWARRCMPSAVDPPPGQVYDGVSRHETFAARLEKVINSCDETPGLAWPIYTHLGGMSSDVVPGHGSDLPSPYLDLDVLKRLQDTVFGVTQSSATRIWFTRPSVLYDYSLILQGIADHLVRDANSIHISSWWSDVLDCTLPVSKAQLYGLTFYVEDAQTATIHLDGERIETVVRNPADATGSQSVTIAECEIQHSLFRLLDPMARDPQNVRLRGSWTWRDQMGFLDGELQVPLYGLKVPGAQVIAFTAAGSIGLELQSSDGGRFYFGPPELARGDETATYLINSSNSAKRIVAPLHDLNWLVREPGGAFPSHPIDTMTIRGSGAIADVVMLRPRATTLKRRGFCVTGHAPHADPGETVQLGHRSGVVDALGFFAFEQVAEGVYSLSCGGCVDRRGSQMEVTADVTGLILDRRL